VSDNGKANGSSSSEAGKSKIAALLTVFLGPFFVIGGGRAARLVSQVGEGFSVYSVRVAALRPYVAIGYSNKGVACTMVIGTEEEVCGSNVRWRRARDEFRVE